MPDTGNSLVRWSRMIVTITESLLIHSHGELERVVSVREVMKGEKGMEGTDVGRGMEPRERGQSSCWLCEAGNRV